MTNFLDVEIKYKATKVSNLIAVFVILFVFSFVNNMIH